MSPKIFCMPLKDNKEHKVGIGEEGICFHPLIISHLNVFSSVFHDSIRLFVHLFLLLGVSFGLPILQTLNKNTYQSYRIVPFSLSVSSFWQDTTHFQLCYIYEIGPLECTSMHNCHHELKFPITLRTFLLEYCILWSKTYEI